LVIAICQGRSLRFETNDYIRIYYAYDSDTSSHPSTSTTFTVGSYTLLAEYKGSGASTNLSLDGLGVTTLNTGSLTDYTYSIPSSGTRLSIRIVLDTDGSDEEILFDNIRIQGTGGATPVSSSITSQINNVCNGDALGSLTVTASDGSTPYTYNWSNSATSSTISTLLAGTYTVTVTDAGGTTATSSATITEPTALNTTISSQTNVACFGESTGSLTASVTGGTSPYTYNWNSGETSATISGKAAGTYTVSVLDNNGCGEGPPP